MKKIFKNIILGLLIFTLGFGSVYTITKADSGWDSDYDSGSSWDSDWDSGSSWDSDWDYGSSWDSDWSPSSYSSSSSSGEPSLSGIIIVTIILVAIITMILTNNIKRGKKINNIRDEIRNNINNLNNNINHIRNSINNDNYYKDIDVNIIKEIDPNLDINEFKQKAYNIYKDIQVAWMNFDIEKIRKLTTDEVYNMYKSQLETLKLKKQKNIMNGFELLDVKVYDISKVNDIITLKVFLNVKMYDYVIKENTGEITRGTDKMKMNISYELSFVKSATDSKKINTCPNCGAPVDIIASSTCQYCDSTLVKDSSDYVLSKKTSVGQIMER